MMDSQQPLAAEQAPATMPSDMPETGPSTAKAPVIERLLIRIGATDEFPTISKHLHEINRKISDDIEASNASELAGVILQDYALTNKLLKLVNSAYYGFAAGKVSTVTRAVVVLGYEHVRLATLHLTLFDHFIGNGKANAADLKETVVASFWAGVLAREIAIADKSVDPEEAFVCAMLGQLGKLLIIYYLPGDYASICSWMAEKAQSEARAVKAVCGVSYEELGIAVARQWNFPVQIYESMQPLTNAALENKNKPPAKLWVLSSLVKEVCHLAQKNGLDPDSLAFKAVLERFKPHIKITKRQLKQFVVDSLDHLEEQAAALEINLGTTTFLKTLIKSYQPAKGQIDGDKTAEQIKPAEKSLQLADGPVDGHGADTLNAKDIIMEGVQEISLAMMDSFELDDVVSMSLEVLFRSLNFNRALMFIQDTKARRMTARFGYGHNAAILVGALGFGTGAQKDLFNLSIHVGKDLIVGDAADPKLTHLIPEWYRLHLNAPAFIFLPVMYKKTCMGAFYADRDHNGAPISEAEHRHLSLLRNQLLLAIKFQQ